MTRVPKLHDDPENRDAMKTCQCRDYIQQMIEVEGTHTIALWIQHRAAERELNRKRTQERRKS